MGAYSPGSFAKYFYVCYDPEPALLQIPLVWSSLQRLPSLAGTPGLARTYLPTRGFTARIGEDEVQFCVPCGSAGFVLLCLQATSHPWPTAPGLWATGHMGGGAKKGS